MSQAPYDRPRGSRRHFLGGAAALGLWPAVAAAQHITANATLQPQPAEQDSASLAARTDAARHLTVQVHINGRGPFNFVVDTGAERSVISDTVATALNMTRGAAVTVQGIIQTTQAPTVRADTVAFGPFVRKDVLLPVLSQATLAADGFLGIDVINGTRVTFDFKQHQVEIDQPHNYAMLLDPVTETRVHAVGKAGRLQIVDCMVDSVSSVAFIDTGAEVSVGNSALLDALKSRRKAGLDQGRIMLTGVTGGEMEAELIPVTRIRMDDLVFTDGMLAIADVPDFAIWNLRYRPALLIGMDYLRQFASVSVDYRNKDIRFELSLAPPNSRPGVEIGAMG